MHAYIIEDDHLIAESIQDMLENLGFTRFSFARSEDVAVFGANEPDIDLITADVRLLPGDGVRAVEAICAKREIPVLFITGFREELEERKPDAVALQKPIQPEALEQAVRQVLRAKATPSDAELLSQQKSVAQ
jgi:DNA-binding response OmpR family regulator